jgi:hypothetical protein
MRGRECNESVALYRSASFLLVLAAAENSFAVERFWRTGGAMNSRPLPENHRVSYGPVLFALGVFCSLCIVFAAYLAWHLGSLAKTHPQCIGALGWMLFDINSSVWW